MASESQITVHVQLHSRYRIFDISGQIPFSIVFGLVRRSSEDIDPRPLRLETARTILDVPYALAHGLLILRKEVDEEEKDEKGSKWKEVDLTELKDIAEGESKAVYLPSLADRPNGHWRNNMTIYHSPIDPNSKLASILEPGKRYRINLPPHDLSGKERWANGDGSCFVAHTDDENGTLSQNSQTEPVKVSLYTNRAGHADFTVTNWSSLHIPLLTTTLLLHKPSKLQVSTTLTPTTPSPITIQTRGHQKFLVPWGIWEPEPEALDHRSRILDNVDTTESPPTSSLQILDPATGEIVWKRERRGHGPLTAANIDRRPKFSDILVLQPGEPVVREIDISDMIEKLEDREYKIRMLPKGCRWWSGDIKEHDHDPDERIPSELGGDEMPPVMLETEDEVGVRVRDGKVEVLDA